MTKTNGRHCRGTKTNGDPCESPVVGEDGFCDAHREGGLAEVRARARRGGEVTREMFKAGLADLPPLDSPAAAQVWLERIGRAVAVSKLSGSAASAATSAVRQWLKAHKAAQQADRLSRIEQRIEQLSEAGVI